MKKKLLILSLITLALINFASAYNGFISDALDAIGMENLFLIIIFLGTFTLSYIPLSRIWKQNTGAAGVLAFLVGLGITAGINYYDCNVSELIYGLGINEGIIIPIAFLALTIFAIIIAIKKGLGILFMSIGALLLVLSYWAYEKSILIGTGAILLFLGIILWWRRRKKKQRQGLESDYSGRGKFAEFDRKVGRGIARGIRGTPRFFKGKVATPAAGFGREAGAFGKWAGKKGWGAGKWTREKAKQRKINKSEVAAYKEKQKREAEEKIKRKKLQSHLDYLKKEYNKIQRQNPNDPKLIKIAEEVKKIRRQR